MGKHDKLSVFISLILRHKPEEINLELDEFGYANVKDLLDGINKSGRYIDLDILQKIVDQDKKQRYSFNDDKTLIRANQGHSVKVNVQMQVLNPPEFLYHGTAKHSLENILDQGIKKMSRLHVHLSENETTAVQVGKRHGEVVVLKVKAAEMGKEGYKFMLSENGVWLTEFVPSKYIEILNR